MTKPQIKILDDLWSFGVKESCKFICLKCGAVKVLHSHHIEHRFHWSTKWDIRNGLSLCGKHHKDSEYSIHKKEEDYKEIIENRLSGFGLTRDELKQMAIPIYLKTYFETLEILLNRAEELNLTQTHLLINYEISKYNDKNFEKAVRICKMTPLKLKSKSKTKCKISKNHELYKKLNGG